MKIWGKFFDWFLTDSGVIKVKIKMRVKASTIFELSALKLRYIPIFMKVVGNILYWCCTNFWLIEAKLKMKKKKILENKCDFWTLNSKIKLYSNFHENLEAKIFDWFLNLGTKCTAQYFSIIGVASIYL